MKRILMLLLVTLIAILSSCQSAPPPEGVGTLGPRLDTVAIAGQLRERASAYAAVARDAPWKDAAKDPVSMWRMSA
jgi:hypothetical protein